jgi:WD40 repeat protein
MNLDTEHGSVSWSPDGRWLAGVRTRDVKLWRTDNWQEIFHFTTMDGGDAIAQGIAWSPTGDKFAAATGELVNVWEVNTGKHAARIRAHYRETNSISWSPDGTRYATGGDDQLIKIWDVQTGEVMLTLAGHSAMVKYLCWSPDGRKLASSDGKNVIIWDASRGYPSF